MGKESHIQWTDATWNPFIGCRKVDADCKFCYMYRDSLGGTRWNPQVPKRTKTVFTLPLKIKQPSKIFTASLTDIFIPEIDEDRHEIWDIIRRCPQHTFQILTKRPERILECLPDDWGALGYENVWLGTSVGHQKAVHRITELSEVPASVLFVSFEPLHEELNLQEVPKALISWSILGGESGHETGKYTYRPCKVEWMESIIEQMPGAMFVKQMGTHLAKELKMSDRHGTKIEEFPESLRIREFPDRTTIQ